MIVKVVTNCDPSRLCYDIERLSNNGYSIQGGISTCVNMGNEVLFTVIMVKNDSNP